MSDQNSPHTARSRIDRIFIGPSGLRPGWRIAIYFVSFFVLLSVLSLIVGPLAAPTVKNKPPIAFLITECIQLFAAVAPAVALGRLEKRPFSAYGMPVAQALRKQFWIGTIWGFASLTFLLVMMRAIGVFHFGPLAVHGVRILKFGIFWCLVFLVVGLFEEFFLRGYILFTLSGSIGFWPASLLLSAIFGASHLFNPGENWIGALGAAVIGLFWCLALRRTGSLWFGVGMHAAWDWAESYLYSVPDSGLMTPGHLLRTSFQGPAWLTGGSVGPEASALLFIVFAVLWLLFNRFYPQVKYGQSETSRA